MFGLLGLTNHLTPAKILRRPYTRKKRTKTIKQDKQETNSEPKEQGKQVEQSKQEEKLTHIEKLPSFIFGEPISWNTGETPIVLRGKLNTLYKKKIKEVLLKSRQKYRPMSTEDLQKAHGFVSKIGDCMSNNPHYKTIINGQIFEEDMSPIINLKMKCSYPMSQSDLTRIKNNAEFGKKGIKNFIEPTEVILRKKLINLYENIDSLDVTSKEFIEIEDLILKLSTRFMQNDWGYKYEWVDVEKWRRLLLLKIDFNGNIGEIGLMERTGLNYIFGNTDSKYVLHNGLLLNDEDVFFLELSSSPLPVMSSALFGNRYIMPDRKSGINYLIKEKRDFMDSFLRKDEIVVEDDRSIGPALPGTISSFLNNDDTMNMGTASTTMKKKTKKERDRIIKKTRRKNGPKTGGRRKNKSRRKSKSRRKNKSRRKSKSRRKKSLNN